MTFTDHNARSDCHFPWETSNLTHLTTSMAQSSISRETITCLDDGFNPHSSNQLSGVLMW
jgi:hypothetical protein